MSEENPLLKFNQEFNKIYDELMLYTDLRRGGIATDDLVLQQFMKAGEIAYDIKDLVMNITDEMITNHEILLPLHLEVMPSEQTRYKKMEDFLKENTCFKFTSEKVMRDKLRHFGDPFFFDDIRDGYKKSMTIVLRCSYEYEILKVMLEGKDYRSLRNLFN